MRQRTAEQIEKARERRQKLSQLTKTLSQKSREELNAIVQSWPTKPNGDRLSLKNACLIMLQGGASVVAGLHDWNKLGRKVKKGQHGLSIWIPLGCKRKAIDADPEASPSMESPTGFGLGTVFDISQTEERSAA